MTKVWCVRAMYGNHTDAFVKGGYAAIGWDHLPNLADVADRNELGKLYRNAYPENSALVSGGVIGQIARFLFEMEPGDLILTPARESENIRVGRLLPEPRYFFSADDPDCPFPHRRPVQWFNEPIKRRTLSVPLQNTLRSLMTVFAVRNAQEISVLVDGPSAAPAPHPKYDAARVVLDRVLELDANEFEVLVGHLLAALGFEDTEVTGKSGDGGVDVRGVLNASGFARIRVSVQAKRYKDGRISANTVKALRSAIPHGEQGAFITTSRFAKDAYEVASQPGFALIGLIDGDQLVDLLIENWMRIPEEFREQLGLKPGLVLA